MRRIRSLMLRFIQRELVGITNVPPGPRALVEVLLIACCIHLKCLYTTSCVCALDALVEMLLSTCLCPALPNSCSQECSGVSTPSHVPLGEGILLPVIRGGSSPTSIPVFRSSGFPMYLMFLGALVELLLLHNILCMYVPPVPWCPCRTASDHVCS